MRTLFKGSKVVLPHGVEQMALGMENEKIVYLGTPGTTWGWDQVVDISGKYLLPGFIDVHVHLEEVTGGAKTAHSFAAGTGAALQGGITTVIDFITPRTGEKLGAAMARRLAQAREQCHTDYSFHCVLRELREGLDREMGEVIASGISSFKVYTVYEMAVSLEEIRELLALVAAAGGVMLIHSEERETVDRLQTEFKSRGLTAATYHAAARPLDCENGVVGKLVRMAGEVKGKVYFVHLSGGTPARVAWRGKKEGAPVYLETCPHYLAFSKNKLAGPDGPLYMMSPPLRDEEEREDLWQLLAAGAIDVLATDHCPFTRKQKLAPAGFTEVPGGVGGLQYLLPFFYTYGIREGRISWEQLVRMSAGNPAKIFNLPGKGCLSQGADGDLVIFSPEGQTRVNGDIFHGAEDYSIYENLELAGRVDMVYLRGKQVFKDGAVTGRPGDGRFVGRQTDR